MSTALKKPKVHGKIKKAKDLEVHVMSQFVAGTEFIEIRDYVPSTKTYARGISFEKHLLGQVREIVDDLDDRLSPSGEPGPGQQTLDV